jgi:NitT/TauT family transport system substrate-binding protein
MCTDPLHLRCGHGLSRREFVRLGAMLSLAMTLPACGQSPASGGRSRSTGPVLKIGYIPITDATPLLIAHAKGMFEAEGLQVEKPTLIRSWATLSESFLARQFNLCHLLLPIPIQMRFGAGKHRVKVVAWNHMNGSAITVGTKTGIARPEELGGKQIAVPYWYSMHNVMLQGLLREHGLEVVVQPQGSPLKPNQTNLFVMSPPDMPTAMSNGKIDGYVVAEPFNAVGELLAGGKVIRFTGENFRNHPCCVATMHEQDIDQDPDWAGRILTALVKAQRWVIANREETALILSKDGQGYLPFPKAVVERAMLKYDVETYGGGAILHPDWGLRRVAFNPYPYESATRDVVSLLKRTRVEGDSAFMQALEPDQVVRELFNYDLVKSAIAATGGMTGFDGLPTDTGDPFRRTESISFLKS